MSIVEHKKYIKAQSDLLNNDDNASESSLAPPFANRNISAGEVTAQVTDDSF